jgi:hypothetical protein
MSNTQNTEGETPAPQSQEQAPVTGEKIIMLKKILNYFGENSKTTFEHSAYSFIKEIIKDYSLPSLTEADAIKEAEEILKGLNKISNYSDVGSHETAIINMKSIASDLAAHVRARMTGRCG